MQGLSPTISDCYLLNDTLKSISLSCPIVNISLSYLQAEGLYHYLCDQEYSNSSRNVAIETRGEIIQSNKTSNIHESDNVQCLAQRLALTQGYTVGMGVFGLCAMPVGYFFDKFGLRPTRTLLG